MTQQLVQYSYLQVLDFMTTTAFLVNGIREGNPLVRMAIHYGPTPLSGLLFVKLIAVGLGVYCWRFGKARLLSRINILFALVVTWNLAALIIGSISRAA
jgi:Domain of unknown function (DUF5658)